MCTQTRIEDILAQTLDQLDALETPHIKPSPCKSLPTPTTPSAYRNTQSHSPLQNPPNFTKVTDDSHTAEVCLSLITLCSLFRSFICYKTR